MKEKLKKFLDIIFPPDIICIYCGNEIKHPNKYLACDECLQNLPYLKGKICNLCGAKLHSLSDICFVCHSHFPPYKMARSTFIYEMPLVRLVHKMKFGNARYLFKPLAECLTKTYIEYDFNCDVIVPVPLSKERLKERGYNQAEELAKVVAKNLGLELVTNAVEKVINTERQSQLNFSQRMENLKGAYRLKDHTPLKGKKVLVIDDVMTTGATIRAVCDEILKAKPAEIYVLTLAHTDITKKPIQPILYKFKKLILAKINRELRFAKNRARMNRKIRKILRNKNKE